MDLSPAIPLATIASITGTAALLSLRGRAVLTDSQRWSKFRSILIQADAPMEIVADAVRRVMAHRCCSDREEVTPGRVFRSYYRRDPWTLGVKIEVTLKQSGPGTGVTIRCFPEWFVNEETIAKYHGHLVSFLNNVCKEAASLPESPVCC